MTDATAESVLLHERIAILESEAERLLKRAEAAEAERDRLQERVLALNLEVLRYKAAEADLNEIIEVLENALAALTRKISDVKMPLA